MDNALDYFFNLWNQFLKFLFVDFYIVPQQINFGYVLIVIFIMGMIITMILNVPNAIKRKDK